MQWCSYGERESMLVEIESFEGDVILLGKKTSLKNIKKQMMEILEEVDESDFVEVFSARYGYERVIADSTIEVDCTIDLDTHKVFE